MTTTPTMNTSHPMPPLVTFGEVMTRFTTPGFLRMAQALPGPLEVTFGGAEANVAASAALLGMPSRFISAVPRNPLGEACCRHLTGLGVDTGFVVRVPGSRLGSYYLETGANQRPSAVTYDREHSAIATHPADGWDWPALLSGAGWFHTTGITLAISESAAEAAIAGARAAHERGIPVSCDLNYRGKLWKWGGEVTGKELARRTIARLMPYVDLVIANEQDADDMFAIRAGGSDVHAGHIDAARYRDVAIAITERFPNVKRVAITLRESVSATYNRWGAMLYEAGAAAATDSGAAVAGTDAPAPTSRGVACFSPLRDGSYTPFEITSIVDRVGAGDSFGAALIVALRDPSLGEAQTALDFAVAASALCHSVVGDINYVTRDEVLALAGGNASGRVQR